MTQAETEQVTQTRVNIRYKQGGYYHRGGILLRKPSEDLGKAQVFVEGGTLKC